MRSVDVLIPDDIEEAVPFSVRLAERRIQQPIVSRSDRRAHARRSVRDLNWLRFARLAKGDDVQLVDLSEGGALLELESPLKPGTILSLEIAGRDLDLTVPFEVLRCYVSRLRGDVTIYRGACVFAHLIELPKPVVLGATLTAVPSTDFVGTNAALGYLLKRCAPEEGALPTEGGRRVTLERTEILHILESLHARRMAGDAHDPLNRHAADLLGAILPVLRRGAARDIVTAALDERLLALPERWRMRLQSTRARLASLIDVCADADHADHADRADHADQANRVQSVRLASTLSAPNESLRAAESARAASTRSASAEPARSARSASPETASAEAASAFQKIVVRFADGTILKGFSQDFHPTRPQFSLWPSINAVPSDRVNVPVSQLKAVFFVRDFQGNPAYRERKTFVSRTQGRRVEVTFTDGEAIVGTTLNYRPDGQGFFVSPADAGGNNTRIFVVGTAVRRVRFL
jgi:Family of unknown function (DUF6982)/PilZ domain